MSENLKKFLKHYFLILIWIGYFTLYYHYEFTFVEYIKEKSTYGIITFWYFNALVSAFMVYSLVTIFERWVEKIFHFIFSLLRNQKHETIAREFLIQFLDIFKFYGTLYIFFKGIHLPSQSQELVDRTASILLIIICIFFINALMKIIFEKWVFENTKSKTSLSFLPFITKIISIFIWIIWIVIIVSNLGYNVSTIIAWAGIWGIALALAAQKSLTNIFGAVTILLNRPFKVGDSVKINNFTGKVKDIGLSYLTIIDLQGHTVMIPNENIITTSIENLTDREYRRTEFIVWVTYETSLEKLKKWVHIIEEIFKIYAQKNEITDKYRVTFKTFGPYSLDICVVYFSLINNDMREYEKQKERINFQIKESFSKAKIDIAFPTQEYRIKNGSDWVKKSIKLWVKKTV